MDKVCIIGGGASALMCCAFATGDVTVYEFEEKVGKKILATGNGRCNLSNLYMNKYSYNANVNKFYSMFTNEDAITFFNKLGLETYADEEGRVYPISNTATSVLAVLKNYISTKDNVNVLTGRKVVDLKKQNDIFEVVFEDGKREFFNKVVVASGNKTNLIIFDKFNIAYDEFKPSLFSLKTTKHKNLSGVRVSDVLVKVKTNDINFSEAGEILFKDEGISGIVIFNLSAYLARKKYFINNSNNEKSIKNNQKVKLFIDFLPKINKYDLIFKLNQRKESLKNYHSYEFLKREKVNQNVLVKNLTYKDISNIASVIKNYSLEILGYYDNNQVCSGGICLSELNNNLESNKCKGLYFIGEVVDVDGVCGGYNLQWAWTSGKIVGEQL